MNAFFNAAQGQTVFDLWGIWHVAALLFFACAIALTYAFRCGLKRMFSKAWARIAWVLPFVVLDVLFYVWQVENGLASPWAAVLTLSLCRFALYLSFYTFIAQKQQAFKLLYFAAVGGVLTLVYPSLLTLGPDRFRYYHYFLNHIFFMWVSWYGIVVNGWRIHSADFYHALKVLLSIAGAVLVIDIFFNKNYLYLYYLPVDLAWAQSINYFPVYTIIFVCAMVLICYLMVLPWQIADRKLMKKRKR